MDSFYGGKQGISFIIKDKFDSIDAMNEAFSDASYNKTWYDQYCIINTLTSNHVDNGKIFRRTGYRAKEENGTQWAEYVGRITGPAGGVPNVKLSTIQELKTNFVTDATNSESTIYYPTTNGYSSATTTNSNDLKIQEAQATTTSPAVTGMYRSGKEYGTNETPAFKYGFYTVQGANVNGTILPDATLAIGFEIPYVDFATPTVSLISAHSSPTVSVEEINSFYYKYHFGIPNGLPGAFITDIHSVTAVTNVIYNIERLTYNPNDTTTPYILPSQSITPTSFKTKNVLVGKFKYPVKSTTTPWAYVQYTPTNSVTVTDALFYVADDPAIPSFSVTFNETANQFELYTQNEGDTTTSSVGFVGPHSFGLTSTLLSGQVVTPVEDGHVTNEEIINLTPTEPSSGNLGILSAADVLYPSVTDDNHPNGTYNIHEDNLVFLYIYENSHWKQVGQAISNNSSNINTNLAQLSMLGASVSTYLQGEEKPENNDDIDDFEMDVPWK